MAFTVKGEYERLLKAKNRSKNGLLPFECGCACGYVTRMEYKPWSITQKEMIIFYGNAGLDYINKNPKEKVLFIITDDDVHRRHQDRRYRYWIKYNVLEYFER